MTHAGTETQQSCSRLGSTLVCMARFWTSVSACVVYFVSRVVCLAVCALSVQVLHFNQDRRAVVYADRAETPALSAVIPLRSHKGLHPCAQSAADSTEHLFLLTAEPLQFPCTPSGLPEADGSLVTGELLYRHCQLQPWR